MTDWTTCRVVRDRDGDLWGSTIAKGERWWANLGYFVSHTTAELDHHYGPIAPVLDADGLPVVTTVGDLTARHIGRLIDDGNGPNGNPYRTAGHQRFREAVLARDPVCAICLADRATVADRWPTDPIDLVALHLDPDDPAHGPAYVVRLWSVGHSSTGTRHTGHVIRRDNGKVAGNVRCERVNPATPVEVLP